MIYTFLDFFGSFWFQLERGGEVTTLAKNRKYDILRKKYPTLLSLLKMMYVKM